MELNNRTISRVQEFFFDGLAPRAANIEELKEMILRAFNVEVYMDPLSRVELYEEPPILDVPPGSEFDVSHLYSYCFGQKRSLDPEIVAHIPQPLGHSIPLTIFWVAYALFLHLLRSRGDPDAYRKARFWARSVVLGLPAQFDMRLRQVDVDPLVAMEQVHCNPGHGLAMMHKHLAERGRRKVVTSYYTIDYDPDADNPVKVHSPKTVEISGTVSRTEFDVFRHQEMETILDDEPLGVKHRFFDNACVVSVPVESRVLKGGVMLAPGVGFERYKIKTFAMFG